MGISADDVFVWATWIGVVALGVGVVCAVAIAVSGNIRDARLKLALSASTERAAIAELKTEQLRKELGPRQVQREIFLKELEGQPSAPVEIVYLRDDPECFDLAQQIWRLLEDAKWPVKSPKPMPVLIFSDNPTSISAGGQPSGVTVVARSVSTDEADAFQNRSSGKPWVRTP